ncbi:MAG: PilZ domain-containing protein, partial [Myxococcota bacterium]
MNDEGRQHERAEVNREFESIEEFIAEYVTNISQGGVFIRSKNPLPVGTKVNLKFSVIVDDFETIEGEGEVVRVDMNPENMGMGVAFT